MGFFFCWAKSSMSVHVGLPIKEGPIRGSDNYFLSENNYYINMKKEEC